MKKASLSKIILAGLGILLVVFIFKNSLLLLFNLIMGNIFLYYVLIFIFPFLLYKGKVKINILIIFLALIFGFFHFFYENEITGENYIAYLRLIESNGIPYFNYEQNAMPGYFIFTYFLKNFLYLDPEFIQKFLRFFIFLLMLFGIKDLAKFTAEKYNFSSEFILYSILVFAIDWNTNFLLIGDQFRNAFAQLIFIYFILFLLKQGHFEYILFGLITMAFHKMFIFITPFTFLLFRMSRFMKSFSRKTIFFIFPGLVVIFVKLIQLITRNYFNILGFGDKFHHSVPTGLEAVTRGVVLALIFYGFILFLSYRDFDKIKRSPILFFCFIFFFFNFVISKVNILGINFVEMNRSYILFAPCLAILFAYLLYKMKKREVLLILLFYAIYNFALINFAKQTYAPTLKLVSTSIFDFVKIYFNENFSQMLLGVSYFLISIPIINVINRNRFIFNIFSILNVVIFSISYLLGIKGLSISVFYLMLFSIWHSKIKEHSIFGNILFNIGLFTLWGVTYLFFNKMFISMELNEIMFNSLLIWGLIVLCWNFLISSKYLIKVKKIHYG